MNFTILAKSALLLAATACLAVSATAQTVLEPTATLMAAADNAAAVTAQDLFIEGRPTTIIPNPDNPNLPAEFTMPREVSSAADFIFAVRQRTDQGVGLLWQSFFVFDISAIPAADLAAPDFVATIDTTGVNIPNGSAPQAIDLGVAVVPAALVNADLLAQEYVDPASLTFTRFADEDGNISSNLIAREDILSADITSLVLDAANAGETELFVVLAGLQSDANTNGGFGNNAFAFDALTVTAGLGGIDPVVLLGDANCDNEVNFLDIAPFIQILSAGGDKPQADANEDGDVTFLDIAPFIVLLSNAGA